MLQDSIVVPAQRAHLWLRNIYLSQPRSWSVTMTDSVASAGERRRCPRPDPLWTACWLPHAVAQVVACPMHICQLPAASALNPFLVHCPPDSCPGEPARCRAMLACLAACSELEQPRLHPLTHCSLPLQALPSGSTSGVCVNGREAIPWALPAKGGDAQVVKYATGALPVARPCLKLA